MSDKACKTLGGVLFALGIALGIWCSSESYSTWQGVKQNTRDIEHIKEHIRELEDDEHNHH